MNVRVVLPVVLTSALSMEMNRPLMLPGVLTLSECNDPLDGSVSSSCRLVRARKSSTQCTQMRLSFFRP